MLETKRRAGPPARRFALREGLVSRALAYRHTSINSEVCVIGAGLGLPACRCGSRDLAWRVSAGSPHGAALARSRSLDHPVGAQYQSVRNLQADCFGGFEVDDELEIRRLLHRHVGGFGAAQYLGDL